MNCGALRWALAGGSRALSSKLRGIASAGQLPELRWLRTALHNQFFR